MREDLAAALFVGAVSAALLLGALAFQYWGGLAPCEMCIWQRWPHLASAVLGLGGGGIVLARLLPPRAAAPLAVLAALALALSGAIGVDQAGVEWKWWPGPGACTGSGLVPGGGAQFAPFVLVRCDEAQWRLLGISLAGYNALVSFAVAAATFFLLWRRKDKPA